MIGRHGGGPETYEYQLLHALERLGGDHEYHVFCLNQAAVEAFALDSERIHYHLLKPANRLLSMTFSLPLAVRRARIDVFHSTFTPPPFMPSCSVFTMHDTSMFDHPEYYPTLIRIRLNSLIRYGLRGSRQVLCISEYVRQAVKDRFCLPDARLSTVWHGIDKRFKPVDRREAQQLLARKYAVEGDFLLYVGKFEKRKNIFRILEAYRHFIAAQGRDIQLVMVGKPDWNENAVMAKIAALGLQGLVVTPGYVCAEDLPALYSGARMFVFPSLWEGFGFPVLEAMACGLPVVTSNTTGLAEVAGDAALLVDPEDSRAIAEAMLQCQQNESLRQQLIDNGYRRLALFSWKQCARQTLRAYEQALADCRRERAAG